jgi:hypothetical protein
VGAIFGPSGPCNVQDRRHVHGTKDMLTKAVQNGTVGQQQLRATANSPSLVTIKSS